MLRFLTKSARPQPASRPPVGRRISVVIPSYNHAAYIAQAIGSVLDQDRPVDELIIVDDRSTDASRAVIAKAIDGYAGPVRILCDLLDRNGGAHAAIAHGLSKASGDVLTILNSDDAYAPDRFRAIHAALPPDGDFIAFTGVDFMDDSGARLAEDDPVRVWYRDVLGQAGACPTIGFALLRANIAVTSGNLVFSRGLYKRVGPFAAYRMCHDWDFLIRCMVHVEPIFVPGAHLRYRTHLTNTLKSTGDLMHSEGSAALKTYLALIARGPTANRLAPTPENWPVYFRFFIATYAPWFTGQPIEKVARQLFPDLETLPSWLSAAPVAGGFLTAPTPEQDALALRRVVDLLMPR
ncbi:Undecaprenyl-phosphate 4-deoxy-4-formamido-L-arabinose transferase [Methylobacterium tardum]|nr:glycosyltransferase family A protein [Methylobacterium tardum]GJE52636.1 Undecaprenyl-phosphate 4-deoxy-4-formamido-L-arabinose transferase [Methylobacterium tardum]